MGYGTATACDHQIGRGRPDSWQCSRRGLRHRREPSSIWQPEATKPGASISYRSSSSGPRPRRPNEESTPISSSATLWNLEKLGRQFDTVIDCGLFHTFSDEEQVAFVWGLTAVLGTGGILYLLCFSDEQPGTEGPRRVSQQEIRDTFHDGWNVKQIEPTHFESNARPGGLEFGPGAQRHGWRRLSGREGK